MQASDSKKQEAPIVQQPKEISLLPHDNVHHHIHPQQTRQQLQLKEELEHQLQQLQEQKPPPVPPHQIPLKQQQVQFQQDKHQHQSDVRAEDLHHQHQQQKQHTIPGMGPPDNRKVLKKKMSTGNLRSPTVKRSAQAPVTMQGWLWKQGSDGFMRWKRRWFVLSDFCLFYYKGPEEDKLLGSILLPSYAISPCPNDNKVMKKFAFKLALKATTTTTATSDIEMAEHQNMRTYYFAADTKESLQQWLNAMSMATILQKDANSCQIYDDHLDSSHCSDSHNASTANEDEDSGFTSYHSRRYIGSPPDGSSPMNGSYTSDSLHLPDERYHDAPNDPSRMPHERSMNMYLGNNEKYPVPPYAHPHYYKNPKARQHLYANAPPKPRRLGPDQYGTVGEPPRAEQMMYNNGISHRHPDNFQDNQHDYPPPEYSATNKNVGSPANKEPVPSNRGRREVNYPHVQQGVWNPQVEYSGGQKEPNEYPPETARDPNEDFNNVENSNRMPRQPVVQGQDPGFQDEYDPAVLRQKGQRLYNAQRPHSANFLEYDAYEKQPENQYDQDPAVVRRVGKENLMRPKSSIERYGTPPNYWNEMTHQPLPPLHTPHTNPQAWGIMEQSPMSERNGWYQENPEQYNQPPHDYYSDAKYVTSVEMISPRVARETRVAAQRDPQFMRSASARLPSGGSRSVQGVDDLSPYSQDDLTDNDPKRVQQREESMKRLLEWKQRMLQSPFTKKHPQKLLQQEIQSQSPSSSEEYRKPSMIKKDPSGQEVGLEHRTASLRQSQEKALKHHEANSKAEDKKQSDEKNARLPVNPSNERIVYQPPLSIHASIKNSGDGKPSIAMMNQYRSSYSSDDEAENVNERKHVRRVPQQAGKIRKNGMDKSDNVKLTPSPPSHDYVNIRMLNANLQSEINSTIKAKSSDALCSHVETKKEFKDESVQTNFPFEDPFCSEELRRNWKLMLLRPPSSRDDNSKYSDSGYDTLRPECPSPSRSRIDSPTENNIECDAEASEQPPSAELCGKHDMDCHKTCMKTTENNDFVVHVSCSVSQGKINRCIEAVDVYAPSQVFEHSSKNNSSNCKMKNESKKRTEKFYDDISEVKKFMSTCSVKKNKPLDETSESNLVSKQKVNIKRLEELTACVSHDVLESKSSQSLEAQVVKLNLSNRDKVDMNTSDHRSDFEGAKNYLPVKEKDSPPKNIVQERIRIFEAVSTDGKKSEDSSRKNLPTHQSQNSDSVLQIKQLELNRKRSRKLLNRRQFHSDTEAELCTSRLSSEDEDDNCNLSHDKNDAGNLNFSLDKYKALMKIEQEPTEEYYLPMGGKFRKWLLEKSVQHAENDEAQYIQMDEQGFLSRCTDDEKRCSVRDIGTKSASDLSSFTNVYSQNEDCYDDAQNIRDMYEPIYAELNHSEVIQYETESTKAEEAEMLITEVLQHDDYEEHQYENLNIPDLLLKSEIKESDVLSSASDADDEASKDLNLPSLSMNDSFRPASYYLKSKKYKKLELDSSDEDLESPPPIPMSPPPLDELEGIFSQKHLKMKLDSINESSTYFSSTDVPLSDDQKKFCAMSNEATELASSPLRSNLNYSYYRVYEDDTPYESGKLLKNSVSEKSDDSGSYQEVNVFEAVNDDSQQCLDVATNHEGQSNLETVANCSPSPSGSTARPPYYYSDLGNCAEFSGAAALWNQSLKFEQLLNNSRPLSPACNKQDVGRKVNKIQKQILENLRSQNVAEELNRSIKLLELKNLSSAEKNTYEADTLKIHRHRTPVSMETKVDLRNMFPFGLRDKALSSSPEFSVPRQRRSRSLEGLLNIDADLWTESPTQPAASVSVLVDDSNIETNIGLPSSPEVSSSNSFLGQRNGDLGCGAGSTESKSMTKDIRRISRSLDELDSVSLYAETNKSDLDREKLRQWDMMSSAPLAESKVKIVKIPKAKASADSQFQNKRKEREQIYQQENELGLESVNQALQMQQHTTYQRKCLEWQKDNETFTNSNNDSSYMLSQDHYSHCDNGNFESEQSSHNRSQRYFEHRDSENSEMCENDDTKLRSSKRQFQCHPRMNQKTLSEHKRRDKGFLLSDMVAVNHLYKDSSENENESTYRNQEACATFKLKNTSGNSALQSIRVGGGSGLVNEDLISESGSGSFKGIYLSRTQPRRRNKSDLILEEPNLSDPELHLRNTQSLKLPKHGKQTDSSEGSSPRFSMSAGDLLGKTHEELILLLIQLRRTQSRLQKAIDTCRMELEGEKKLVQIDVKNRESHSRKVEELTIQLEEYMKQSDVNIPLVNLVDNMVKLGSLYGDSQYLLSTQNQIPLEHYAPPKKMIEFTRRLQEQRLAQNEWPQWRQLVPDQKLIQDKLQHLYMLDKSLQEESVVLTNLQQDKEMLERALSGIHMKAESTRNNVTEQERLLKQQHLVESELTKVQLQLSNTTKKLEETAFENTKIEREILLLRQKIQNTIRRTVPNPTVYMEDSETVQLKMQLEEELAHVQNIMEELSKRRNKINGAVQQLKEDGQKKVHEVRPSPTGVAGRGSAPLPGRKHSRSTYLETDLDTLETRDALDVGIIDETKQPPVAKPRRSQIPLYVNSNSLENQTNCPTGNKLLTYLPDRKEVEEFMEEQDTFCQDINEADEKMKRFYGILPRDKPSEVKTVRIVKRESERRNKTKDRGRKVLYDEQQSLTRVLEEPDSIMFEDFDYLEADVHATDFQRSMSLPRNYGRASYIPLHPPNSLALTTSASSSVSSTPTSTSSKVLPNVPYYYRTPSLSPTERFPSAHEQLFGFSPLPGVTSNLESPTNSPLATPVFQSEAARQIVAETAQQFMSSGGHEGDDEDVQDDEDVFRKLQWSGSKDAAGSLKRRHKRRHYTISSSQPLVLESHTPKMVHARSRDDLDMERCLRSANTPDVVKSTIKKTDTNFDESTIDRELGLPQKIVIPERYVEQEEEELTAEEKLHRLQKAESIKKMLSETTTYGDLTEDEIANASETLKKKFEQEKKQREQLLSLNQLLAQEVKERSKAVAAKAMQNPPELDNIKEEEDEDLSPVQPLPTIQQRENYLT